MDINPLSRKHVVVIPKPHAQFVHQVSDEVMAEMGVALKRISQAIQAPQYNILQNNGKLAHQEVEHVHFHIIPKPTDAAGAGGLNVDPWVPLKFTGKDDDTSVKSSSATTVQGEKFQQLELMAQEIRKNLPSTSP